MEQPSLAWRGLSRGPVKSYELLQQLSRRLIVAFACKDGGAETEGRQTSFATNAHQSAALSQTGPGVSATVRLWKSRPLCPIISLRDFASLTASTGLHAGTVLSPTKVVGRGPLTRRDSLLGRRRLVWCCKASHDPTFQPPISLKLDFAIGLVDGRPCDGAVRANGSLAAQCVLAWPCSSPTSPTLLSARTLVDVWAALSPRFGPSVITRQRRISISTGDGCKLTRGCRYP